MSNLNWDILYLIFEELKDDGNALFSCLLVNKNWFNVIIPILWKNPWKYLKGKSILLKVIISHLSDESRNNITDQNIFVLTNLYQKPFFEYISFCRHLNFNAIIDMLYSIFTSNTMPIILKEVINLFINENMKFTHLYLPNQFDYKIHLISGFKYCFLELEFLQYDLYHNNQDVLEELAKLSKSIKNLEIRSHHNNDDTRMSGIIKLIEAQKELRYLSYKNCDKLLRKSIEESLIKHADTLHYLKIDNEPITKFLSYLVNLVSLELDGPGFSIHWKLLEDVSLPHLKLLKAKEICSKHLEKLIESTNGKLNEVSIHSFRYYDSNNDEIIQTIIKNCPNLKYLMLMLKNKDIIKFEELLTNCQYLNGLNLVMNRFDLKFDWNKFFEILTKSSPIGLFKFKFYFCRYRTLFSLESMNLFFDKWKGRRPMLLQTLPIYDYLGFKKYFDLIEKYKAEGVVKRYENVTYGNTYETFEWIKKRT